MTGCLARFASWGVLALLLGFSPTPLVGAQVPQPDSARASFFEREQELSELLDFTSRVIGTPIEYVSADVAGIVSIRFPGPVTADVLWEFVNRTLVTRGLTSVQLPGSSAFSIVKLADAASLARLEDGGSVATRAGFAKAVVQLGHERTDSIHEAIKLVLTKNGTSAAFKDTRSILVADLRANVLQAQGLALRLDAAFDEMSVVEVPLQHATPTALTALVDRVANAKKAVFGDKGKGAVLPLPESKSVLIVAPVLELDVWRGLIDQFDRSEPVRTVQYTPRRFGLQETARLMEQVVRGDVRADDAEPWRLVIDTLTGTLIVTTTPSRHAEVNELLERLEAMAQASKRPIRSYGIQNRPVEELVGLLQGLLDAGALKGAEQAPVAAAATTTQAQGVSAPLPSAAGTVHPPAIKSDELGAQVILAIDKPTNRLIAMGESRVLEQLEALLAELDVRQPQVLVEALVVTLTDAQTRSLGVELQKMGVHGDVQYQLASLFGLGAPDPAFGNIPAAGGTGFGGVVLDPGNFSGVLRALETVNEGRSLTIPKLLVNNNQPATLNSVLQTPFASTNASQTVATTSLGGTLDAGTEITVTPQIADGGQLVLDYSISLSSFVGAAASPTLPPPRQENSLKSVATVPDGHTVVVGGLEVASESEARARVPVLGAIPFVGALFGDRSKSTTKTRFFVFLRCNVMRATNFEDLRYAGRPDLAAARVEDGLPRLAPRIMR